MGVIYFFSQSKILIEKTQIYVLITLSVFQGW